MNLPRSRTLGVKRQPDAVMPQNLGQVAATAPEDIEIAGMGIALQLLLNRQSQALHAPAHVRVAGRDPDPDAARDRDHRRAKMASTRASAATSTPASTMTRRSFTISISCDRSTVRREPTAPDPPRPSPARSRISVPQRRPAPCRTIVANSATASARCRPPRGRRDRSWRLHALRNNLEFLLIGPAPPPTGFNNAEPFKLSTALIAVHKDCYTALNQIRQGGLHRRKTMKVKGPRPSSASRLHRLSMWVMSRSRQAL